MEAEDVAAFMMADDDEQPAVAPARPVPRAKAPKAPTKAPAKAPPKQPVPPQAKQAKRAPAPAPPPPRASPGPSAQDIRQLLMEEETVNMPSAPASSSGGGRFEPLSSEIEVEAVRRTTGGAGARGGGFLSVLVVGTEERSETMEETARTFVAYRIEAQKEGGGPYIIYRRYKQFEVLHSRCRQQGMKVGKLPERRPGNWFGLKAVDHAVVAERVPLLQSWLQETLQLPQAATCKFLQEWLSPVQLGDISEKKFQKIMSEV